MIRMETDWCRGYMMLQMAEEQAGVLIQQGDVPGIKPSEGELLRKLDNSSSLVSKRSFRGLSGMAAKRRRSSSWRGMRSSSLIAFF